MLISGIAHLVQKVMVDFPVYVYSLWQLTLHAFR